MTSPFDSSALWRQLHDLERKLAFDGNPTPQYDCHGRPIDEARQPLGHSIIEVWGRVRRVQDAISDAQHTTLTILQQDFAGLKIEMIWPMLWAILHDVVLYVGGGALTGAVALGTAGAF